MKSSAWYNKLWQTKMQELPVQGDEHAAWQKMLGLLDQEMPVTPSGGGTSTPAKPWWVGLTFALIVLIIALLYYAGGPLLHHKKYNIKTVKREVFKNKSNNSNTNSAADNLQNNKQTHNNNLKSSATTVNNKAGNKTVKNNTSSTSNASSGFNSSVGNANNIHLHNKDHHSPGKKHSVLSTATIGPKSAYAKSQYSKNNLNQLAAANNRSNGSMSNQYLADSKASSNKVNGNNTVTDSAQKNNTTASVKSDNTSVIPLKTSDTDTKQTAKPNTGETKSSKNFVKNSSGSKTSSSKFQLGLKIGVNTNGSFTPSSQNIGKLPIDAFLGISGSYAINSKFGVQVGINVLSPKVISAGYSNNNIKYTTLNDSNKQVVHNTGKLTIHGSEKVYNIDIPVLATYKASNLITIQAGPVIGIPVKHNAIKTTLSSISSTADTTAAAELKPYLNSTKINNNLNLSLSGGVRLNLNKFYIDAGYLQGISPYTISSGLGSNKVYYHTFQFGIGYRLFKSKK